MLRRCLETPKPRFGMIMPPRTAGGGTDFGTLLEIRTVQMFPDGRSMVETWGVQRFRVVERGTLDGYMVGRIELCVPLIRPAPIHILTKTRATGSKIFRLMWTMRYMRLQPPQDCAKETSPLHSWEVWTVAWRRRMRSSSNYVILSLIDCAMAQLHGLCNVSTIRTVPNPWMTLAISVSGWRSCVLFCFCFLRYP